MGGAMSRNFSLEPTQQIIPRASAQSSPTVVAKPTRLTEPRTLPDQGRCPSGAVSAVILGVLAGALTHGRRPGRRVRTARAAAVTRCELPPDPKAGANFSGGPPPKADSSKRADASGVALSAIATTDAVKTTVTSETPKAEKWQPEDGSSACISVAYNMSDVAFIFPITPSTAMAEGADQKMAKGEVNIFGQVPVIMQMQSEAGAAGAVHGAVTAGALATTFTASQGLLLMIPNMYKIAGELQPAVFHVAARSLAGQALSIFGDHSDVMAARQTGFSFLSSHNVQECQDLAAIAHMSTLEASVPFVHFFDGFRTSHEINRVKVLPKETLAKLMPQDALQRFRDRAVNPTHPTLRGTNQNTDIYFQSVEAANPYFKATPGIVQECMDKFAAVSGRQYKLFDYVGDADAEFVVVALGSVTHVAEEAMRLMRTMEAYKGKKFGVVKVRLFRPWNAEAFLSALPDGVQGIAVLDKSKEVTAPGEPLYMDVASTIGQYWDQHRPGATRPIVVGGRCGLGSKDVTPLMAKAVIDNLMAPAPKNGFSVGIYDDVTLNSLPTEAIPFDAEKPNTVSCLFWGFGSDGTVGANKNAIKIIGSRSTNLYVQGYFAYDAFKSGGVTISHLRFGPDEILSPYEIQNADFVSCSTPAYVKKYDVLEKIKHGGTFVLNCDWDLGALERELPATVKRLIAEREVKFYTIDAFKVAKEAGLGKLINNIMQTAFFRLSGVLEFEAAIKLFKDSLRKSYGQKGQKIVDMNNAAVDGALFALQQVEYPDAWCGLAWNESEMVIINSSSSSHNEARPDFVREVMDPMNRLKGTELPVSKMRPDGVFDMGISTYQKRGVAQFVPVVEMGDCIQCNLCSAICPHACIRPFLLDKAEVDAAPATLESLPAKGKEFEGLNYRIQVSPMDCTGCTVCVETCPQNCLTMVPTKEAVESQGYMENWDYLSTLQNRGDLVKNRNSIKGSQFQTPLFEFHGACEGCGETPYIKLLTQLFGERMVIANATGCTSIVGGTAGFSPYTTNDKGQGPAWANSLFEDNAEFGLGMQLATLQRRENFYKLVGRVLDVATLDLNGELAALFLRWRENWTDANVCQEMFELIPPLLEKAKDAPGAHEDLTALWNSRDQLPRVSQWLIGGDGWAYDIGFGGIDHILSTGANLNILIVDTEVYSNTGGQKSKATNLGAVAKFAALGKQQRKKDLGQIAMGYSDVYVASISMNANYAQTVKAFVEAEQYPGVSIILAYAPCIEHRTKGGLQYMGRDMKIAAETGYWPLYRFDPSRRSGQKNPFQYDTKAKLAKVDVLEEFLRWQNRYKSLERSHPEKAADYRDNLVWNIQARHQKYINMAKETYAPMNQKESIALEALEGAADNLERSRAS